MSVTHSVYSINTVKLCAIKQKYIVPGFEDYFFTDEIDFYSARYKWRVKGLAVKLREWFDPDGYRRVTLRNVNGKIKLVGVHRIVATVFHGNPPTEKHVVNHKNGIRNDNRPENLEWVLPAENERHSWRVLGKNKKMERDMKGRFKCQTLKQK